MTDCAIATTRPALKWQALAVCAGLFVIYLVLFSGLLQGGAVLFALVPAPSSAPALWWRVDKSLTLGGIADLVAAIVPVWIYCRWRGRRLSGYRYGGTALAWIAVLGAQVVLSWWDLRHGGASRGPWNPNPWHLYASAFIGPAAAVAEETFFRGFVMDELAAGGFGPVPQVAVSMLLFGLAHLSYVSTPGGWTIPVFTGLLGGFWSLVYLIGRRSLWPATVAHAINDAVLIPSVFYMFLAHAIH